MTIARPAPVGSGAVEEAVAIWRSLIALGVREALISPGSRSAPFVHALATGDIAHDLRTHVRIDERAAAFTALGISRADPSHPAAVVTTSGTAIAHLHAAVLEAHHSRVPLVVITADRPAELRDTGANQTTHQAGIFGSAVRFSADLPAPSAEAATLPELRTAVSTVARALAAATGPCPGPVHLNIGLRDPLTPQQSAGQTPRPDQPEQPVQPERIVLTRVAPAPLAPPVVIAATGRTVIVAGDGAGPNAARLAAAHNLPLLAEPSSGARSGTALVDGHPSLLREIMADPDHPLRPDRAIVMGRPTLSRPVVSGLLGAEDVDVIVVDPAGPWPDAVRRASLVIPAARIEAEQAAADAQYAFLGAWQQRAQARRSDPADHAWQVRAALAVWDASSAGDTLVLGSSSLVRDLEQHAGPTEADVIANRGLAGIDGVISTATGIALARRDDPGRVRVLMGDLTALHDLTGLIIGPLEAQPDLDIVVVDDGGGRIFTTLEHAAAGADLVQRYFTTPHGVQIAAAGRALGLEALETSAQRLPAVLAEKPPGRRLIVVTA